MLWILAKFTLLRKQTFRASGSDHKAEHLRKKKRLSFSTRELEAALDTMFCRGEVTEYILACIHRLLVRKIYEQVLFCLSVEIG